jgi:hypothetical protein
MKRWMTLCTLVVLTAATPAAAQTSSILNQERKDLDKTFEQAWDTPLVWKFDELPAKGYVHITRVPYAGAIYPDKARGTYDACRKYDQAFHRGRSLAASHEDRDTRAHKGPTGGNRGLFGRRGPRIGIPNWSGHCNGWATASIRHAEPTKSVKQNGVVFSPSDIKSLLAEVYTFTDTVLLGGGYERVINPASLHVTLTNWIGLQDHPVAMESSPGTEIWNFPVYAYNMRVAKNGRRVEVHANVLYKHYLDEEYDKAPKNQQSMYFHYALTLDKDGNIIGGNYYRDSNQIDFLWISGTPTQGGTAGNKLGNPYLRLNRVLALWKASVDDKATEKWVNVNLVPSPAATEPADAVATTE